MTTDSTGITPTPTMSSSLVEPLALRRAPKVTVTREGVSLCQKGVTWWLLFLVNCLWVSKRAKTSRGAGCEPHSSRPPAVECGRTPTEGGPGGGLAGRVIHKVWFELSTY